MKRRSLIASAGTVAATLLAGCSGILGDASEDPTTSTEPTSPEPTTSTEPITPEDTDTSTGTPTDDPPTEPTGLELDTPEALFQAAYTAWAATDPDGFLATVHSTSNYPEEAVRGNVPDFDGELTGLETRIDAQNLTEDEIKENFETAPHLGADDAQTFTGVENLVAEVDPTVEGETPTDEAESFKDFLNTPIPHFAAVEDGEWKLVN